MNVIGQAIAYAVMALSTFELNWDPEKPGIWFSDHQLIYAVLLNLKGPAGILFPLSFVALLSLQSWRLGLRRRQARSVACRLLDDLRHDVFADEDDEIHHHRATLFVRKYSWRQGECLRAWARSGHTMQGSKATFKVPGKHPERVEGVAGRCWAKAGVVSVTGLPDLSRLSDEQLARNSGDLADYAEKTGVSVEWLRRRIRSGPHSHAPSWHCPLKSTVPPGE